MALFRPTLWTAVPQVTAGAQDSAQLTSVASVKVAASGPQTNNRCTVLFYEPLANALQTQNLGLILSCGLSHWMYAAAIDPVLPLAQAMSQSFFCSNGSETTSFGIQ